jgi:hypothetical protein
MLAVTGLLGVIAASACRNAACRAEEKITPLPSGAPLTAAIPGPWAPPAGRALSIDFAEAAQADAWLRHPVLGDPSFDSFRRRPGNPVIRGKPPFAWPVNGFLFEDPKTGNWYSYVGHYLDNYGVGPGLPATHCRVYRSTDRGGRWEEIGPIFDQRGFRFQGDSQPAGIAPDVSVVYAGGRYHMAYDWCTDNTSWANAMHPAGSADSGCAYAWADRPEGPFQRAARPILRTSQMPRRFALAGKYPRVYATTLVRRAGDWLALTLTDSGPYFSWGVMAMTAADPAGRWSDPVMALGIEGDRYFPPTVESFPAMVHSGYLYASHTSVAANRNFQAVYRAPVERAHRADAWTLHQHGTAWHAEPVANEGLGIWGQTYSGFVDRQGEFQVLFPSREYPSGLGTINFASRPWDRPIRPRGFVLTGHEGRSLTLLRSAWDAFRLRADLSLTGSGARVVWGYQAPLGPDRHSSGATVHPLALTRHQGLELGAAGWRVVSSDASGATAVAASGTLDDARVRPENDSRSRPPPARRIEISRDERGGLALTIDGQPRWHGNLPPVSGPLGLFVSPQTHLAVARFSILGPPRPAVVPWLYTEALTGAGVSMADWNLVQSPLYRFGTGAVRVAAGGRVKWNFRGRGFRLWSPKGPQFGRCELVHNGCKLAELDLHAAQEQPSRIVYACERAGDGYHALVLRPVTGRLAVDSLDALE